MQYAKDNGFVKMKLADTKRVSYDIYLTMPFDRAFERVFWGDRFVNLIVCEGYRLNLSPLSNSFTILS